MDGRKPSHHTFRDGTRMPTWPFDDVEWATAAAATCVYPHDEIGLSSDEEVRTAYGLLYNWNAVNDDRGLCPDGWHVPTEEDWNKFVKYLGGESVAGGKLKSVFTAPNYKHPRWNSPNTAATDDYGFSAFPVPEVFATPGACGLMWGMGQATLLHFGAVVNLVLILQVLCSFTTIMQVLNIFIRKKEVVFRSVAYVIKRQLNVIN